MEHGTKREFATFVDSCRHLLSVSVRGLTLTVGQCVSAPFSPRGLLLFHFGGRCACVVH